MVRGVAAPESAIEMAETIVITRHGGLAQYPRWFRS